MTNTDLLKKKIAESGLKMNFIADKLDMTYANLWKMIYNRAEFKPTQIIILCDLLHIDDPEERKQIFLI